MQLYCAGLNSPTVPFLLQQAEDKIYGTHNDWILFSLEENVQYFLQN